MAAARQVRYGSLECLVFDPQPESDTAGQGRPRDGRDGTAGADASRPTVAVVLCHGYGAPGHDLAGIGPEWIRELGPAADSVRFVFPAAPHSLAELGMPDGRAWWPINMAQLAEAVQSSSFDQLHDQTPPGIDEARRMLCEAIDAIKSDLVGEETRLVLGGFSQGAMLTMDASLRGDFAPPELLIQFSGTLICRSRWQASLSRLADTFVYQSHGTVDPILPLSSAQSLHQLLCEGDVESEFHTFHGPHTIDGDSITKTATSIKALVERSRSTPDHE